MSRWGKILFFVAAVAFIAVFAIRYVLGGWIDQLYFPLGLAALSFVGAIFIDIKFYLEFFTMRTTKHGLNMGTLILLVLAGLSAINVIAVRKNKIFDVTEEKLFSLSQQSLDILKSLKSPVRAVIFFRGDKNRDSLAAIRETLRPYDENSTQFDIEFYDSYVENAKAQSYLNSLPDKDSAANKVFVFFEQEGRRERVAAPFGEAEITSALVKVTRNATKKIYFLTGHGERDLESEGDGGFKTLRDELKRVAADVQPINLVDSPEIPQDAAVIVVAGPKSALLANEIERLVNYAKGGGNLMVMADPGEKSNIQSLLTPLGVEFSNTYVVSVGMQVQGLGPEVVAATDFDQTSEITKPFLKGNTFALFYLAAEVKKATNFETSWKYIDLVKSGQRSLALSELSNTAKRSELRAFNLASYVKGKFGEKEFQLVAFGDSDFAANNLITQPTNLNLAMNAFAALTGEKELISIRPKQPKATKLTLTNGIWLGVIGAGVSFPILLLVIGSAIWFRRRSA